MIIDEIKKIAEAALLRASKEIVGRAMLNLLDGGVSHTFSKRSCETCQTISGLIEQPFGCVREQIMKVTRDGEDKIKRWKFAAEEVRDLKRRLSKAECELLNSETDLAKFLLPADAKASETFCVWYGDSLIAAKQENGNHSVELRTRGKSWDE